MKIRLSSIIYSIFALNLLLIFSCTEPCDTIYCVPDQGECFDGDCICLIQKDTINGEEFLTYWGGDSCNVNLCQNVPCVNGNCVFGICECTPGFAGDSCSFLLRGPYIDSFTVIDLCSADSLNTGSNFTTFVVADTTDIEFVYLSNFYYDSTSTAVRARVTEFGLEINPTPQDIMVDGTMHTISGTCTPYDSLSRTMNFNYTVTDGNGIINSCSATLVKP